MPGIVEKSSATGDSVPEIGSLLREKHTTQSRFHKKCSELKKNSENRRAIVHSTTHPELGVTHLAVTPPARAPIDEWQPVPQSP
jgi:hypothetical protein